MPAALHPIDPLLTRALRRAIALDEAVLIGGTNCRDLCKGEKPSDIRKELGDFRRLLDLLQPRRKEAAP